MRHPSISQEQELRQRLIKQLLRETIQKEDVVRDIKDTLRSLLSGAEEILATVRRDYLDLGADASRRQRYRDHIDSFYRQARSIMDSLSLSIHRLGSGTEEKVLLRQVERAYQLIERTYNMCMDLLAGANDILNG